MNHGGEAGTTRYAGSSLRANVLFGRGLESRRGDAPKARKQLDIMSRHPGGFDIDFFTKHIQPMLEQWRAPLNLTPEEVVVEVYLADRTVLPVTRVWSALTYVFLLTERDELQAVPTREITRVVAKRRSGPAPCTRSDSRRVPSRPRRAFGKASKERLILLTDCKQTGRYCLAVTDAGGADSAQSSYWLDAVASSGRLARDSG